MLPLCDPDRLVRVSDSAASSSSTFETGEGVSVDPVAVLRRVFWRLMPFLFALYVFAYLDRVNLSYAALSIRRELGFSDTVYGAGAGLFFLSYALFELPSNLMLLRIGPRDRKSTRLNSSHCVTSRMPSSA